MSLGNVNLTPQLVQAVRDAVDISDIAARHTRLEKRGNRMVGLCPIHKEKTPSFSVDPDQGLYYCFGCGAGGDAIKLHMVTTGDDFPAAIESLAREYGIPLPSVGSRSRAASGPDPSVALEAAQEFFTERLRATRGILEYLDRRKIPVELIQGFGLGYAPDEWQALHDRLTARIPVKDLESAGLVARSEKNPSRLYDRFRDRLMFPIRDTTGRLVGFGGRTMGDHPAKYINTAETERFQKRTLLYGMDVARKSVRERGTLVLVEGYFDLLAMVASGIDYAAATMGTALSAEQVRLCARYAERVILCYDGDAAGVKARSRALPSLLGQGLEVLQVSLAEGSDPDTVRLEEGPEALRAAVEGATDALEDEVQKLAPSRDARPADQARAAASIRELLASVKDPVARFAYSRRAADLVGLPVDLLMRSRRDARAADGKPSETNQRREVASLEERALQLLLRETDRVPALEDLPVEEIFLDRECGNIYRLFRRLYEQAGTAPTAQDVLSALPEDSAILDRMARLLVEETACSEEEELGGAFDRLNRRWQRHQLKQLARQITEAQRSGQSARVLELVEEKTALSRLLHEIASDH